MYALAQLVTVRRVDLGINQTCLSLLMYPFSNSHSNVLHPVSLTAASGVLSMAINARLFESLVIKFVKQTFRENGVYCQREIR